MIKHSSDSDYQRIGKGKALSFDEHATYPLLVINDYTGKTLAAYDAEQTWRIFEFFTKHHAQFSKLQEIAGNPNAPMAGDDDDSEDDEY